MQTWRVLEEIDRMKQWDADAVCDALNLTSEELVEQFLLRAIHWIEENNE